MAGTFVLENGIKDVVKVRLPLNLDTVWDRSSEHCFSYGTTYQYAYFWNPLGKGCQLVEGVDYFTADATIERRHANTTSTLPAYERLTDANGELRIVLAFGADKDDNGKLAVDQEQGLQCRELPRRAQIPGEPGLFRADRAGRRAPARLWNAEAPRFGAGPGGGVHAQGPWPQDRRPLMFWGVANIGDESNAFFCMVKEAAERGSVFVYAGHSRVGGLDLEYMGTPARRAHQDDPRKVPDLRVLRLFELQLLQPLLFRRQGLERRSRGNEERRHRHQRRDRVVRDHGGFNIKTIAPILNWSARGTRTTWQQIVNSYSERFLTGVNGDE